MAEPERSVEVYAEIGCPFTHVGLLRLVGERTRRALAGPRLLVRSWPLELVNKRPLDPDMVAAEVEALRAQIAPELFGGFDPDRVPGSSIPAFGLAAAAYMRSDAAGEAVSLAIRHALFEDGLDIEDHAVLWKIGAPFSVQPLSTEAALEVVEEQWAEGKRRGVQGSPYFFVAGRDWFCPSLEITHDDTGFRVRFDAGGLSDFYTAVFGSPPAT